MKCESTLIFTKSDTENINQKLIILAINGWWWGKSNREENKISPSILLIYSFGLQAMLIFYIFEKNNLISKSRIKLKWNTYINKWMESLITEL